MWIASEKNRNFNIGDKVRLTEDCENFSGTLVKGTIVTITDIDKITPSRGYSVIDSEGHKVTEIGWCVERCEDA